VTELAFATDLYPRAAIDEAVAVYARFAEIEVAAESARHVVRVRAASPAREARVLLELANHALGRAVEQGSR